VERKFELYEFKIIVGNCNALKLRGHPTSSQSYVHRFNYEANDAPEYTRRPIKFQYTGEKAGNLISIFDRIVASVSLSLQNEATYLNQERR